MKEILSQSEIDNLLAALASGDLQIDEISETSKKDIRLYDFRRPNKFSKDHLRIRVASVEQSLHMIHDNFCRILSNYLSAYLRENIQVRVASAEQLTYEEFIRSVPSPTLISIVSMEPLKGTAILETNPQFMFPVLDLLFGGPGEIPNKVREFTEIELSVLKKLIVKILENLALAWADIFEINPNLESVETNPRFNQSIQPNEAIALITMATYVGNSKGLINLCIPFMTLDPLVSKLFAHYWFDQEDHVGEENEKKLLEFLLNSSPVKLTACLGDTTLTVKDFLELQPGDIVTLDKGINEEIDLFVEEELKFKTQLGITAKNRIGAQITKMVRDEEDTDG